MRARPRAHRPAQPRPGARAARCGRASTCPTPAPGCSSPIATPTPSSRRCCAGARTSASRRRTATAGSTTTSAPTTGCAAAWTACDGAAGRMTAQNGLHNLPAPLRPAVRAAAGARLRPRRPRAGRAAGARRRQRRPGLRARPPAATTSTPPWPPPSAPTGRPPRSRCSRPCTGLAPARPVRRSRASSAPIPSPWGCSTGPTPTASRGCRCARMVGRLIRFGAAARRRPVRVQSPTRSGGAGGFAGVDRWVGRVAGSLRAQRDHPGVGGRAVQGVGGDGAPRGAPARRPDRPLPPRRAARPRAGASCSGGCRSRSSGH